MRWIFLKKKKSPSLCWDTHFWGIKALQRGSLRTMQILGPHSQRFWFSHSWVGASPLVLITNTPGEDGDMHCQEHVFIFICAKFCMLNKAISDCSKLVKDDRQEIFVRICLESLSLSFSLQLVYNLLCV